MSGDADGLGRRSLLVTRVGTARGSEALAAAIATVAADQRRSILLVELGAEARARRPTLLASTAARELEQELAGAVAGTPVARGAICQLTIGSGDEALDEAAEVVAALPPSTACVVHVPPRLWQPAVRHRGLLPGAALLRAELPRDRQLVALAVGDLRRRGMAVRVASRALGWAAGRRALAGAAVGGLQEPRLRRWAGILLGCPPRPGTGGASPAAGLRTRAAGQALPGVLGVATALIIAALALVSIAGALTGKGRVQRAADLAALSGARSMRDDLPRLTAPPELPNGAPNPVHMPKAVYLARATAAALESAHANGADARRFEVRFPDRASFPPLRIRVTAVADLELEGRREPVDRVAASAVAEALAPAGGAGEMPGYGSGGGYSGRLAYRQGKPMRPDVAEAFDRMSAAAAREGISLLITSAFRSDAEQARLFAQHPDPRWVAPPGKSLHRCATELDLGPSSAYGWLAANARRFGFLKRYSWEPWHFGFVAGAAPCSAAAERTGDPISGPGADGGDAGSTGLPDYVPAAFREPLLRAAARWNVSAAVLAAQLMAESGFDPDAVSAAGAQGIAQFIPSTAASYGLRNPFDAAAAIDAQAHLMSDLLRRFGSVRLALAAYNAGAGAVEACGCVPPYPETIAYVARILALLDGSGALLSPPFEVRLVA